jgi:hypothetical protein
MKCFNYYACGEGQVCCKRRHNVIVLTVPRFKADVVVLVEDHDSLVVNELARGQDGGVDAVDGVIHFTWFCARRQQIAIRGGAPAELVDEGLHLLDVLELGVESQDILVDQIASLWCELLE